MSISKITLEDMLRARDMRAARQEELRAEYGMPLCCFTMCMAGEIKTSPLVMLAFEEGLGRLSRLPGAVYSEVRRQSTGPEAIFVFDGDASALKAECVAIEDAQPAFRLFDMDVIGADGIKLSRGEPRRCAVCGGSAAACGRSRAHGLPAVSAAQRALLVDFAAAMGGERACSALVREVCVTPKPGLVDEANSGAHADMDINTFISSAEALKPYFSDCVRIGLEGGGMDALRTRGIQAEKEMLEATHGANTHKGLIYSIGLLSAAWGMRLEGDERELCAIAAALAAVGTQTAHGAKPTHGETVKSRYGAVGARGEAMAGFPAARRAFAVFQDCLEKTASKNDAAVITLLHIMTELDDTNLLYRGGREGLSFVKKRAEEILSLPTAQRIAAARVLDAELIERNLSPGGAADMLAIALYLDLITEK